MSTAPISTGGRRLGVVIGSSLPTSPFPGTVRRRLTVDGVDHRPVEVELHERDELVVLLRHGADGTVPAHLVDHHAHVRALCAAGCGRVLALGSAGGLHPHLGPGTVVVPDDFLALDALPHVPRHDRRVPDGGHRPRRGAPP